MSEPTASHPDTSHVDDELLLLLCCPLDRSALRRADATTLARLNLAIREGKLVNRSGEKVVHQLSSALIRAAGDLIYPVVDEIPVMLTDEAILLSQIDDEQG